MRGEPLVLTLSWGLRGLVVLGCPGALGAREKQWCMAEIGSAGLQWMCVIKEQETWEDLNLGD